MKFIKLSTRVFNPHQSNALDAVRIDAEDETT